MQSAGDHFEGLRLQRNIVNANKCGQIARDCFICINWVLIVVESTGFTRFIFITTFHPVALLSFLFCLRPAMDLGIAYGSDDDSQSGSEMAVEEPKQFLVDEEDAGDVAPMMGPARPPPADDAPEEAYQDPAGPLTYPPQGTSRFDEPPSGPGPARSDHFGTIWLFPNSVLNSPCITPLYHFLTWYFFIQHENISSAGGPVTNRRIDSDNNTPFLRRNDSTPFLPDRMGESPPRPPGGDSSANDEASREQRYYDLLPAEIRDAPPGQCDPALQARVVKWIQLRQQGRHVTDEFRR